MTDLGGAAADHTEWHVFIATLDRSAVAAERPHGPADKAMRSAHGRKIRAFYRPLDEADWRRALDEAAAWNTRYAAERRATHERLTRYRARLAARTTSTLRSTP